MPGGPFTTVEDSILRLDLRSCGWSWPYIAYTLPSFGHGSSCTSSYPCAAQHHFASASQVLLRVADDVIRKLGVSALQLWGDDADEQHPVDEDPAVQAG